MGELFMYGTWFGAGVGVFHAAHFIANHVSGTGGAGKAIWHGLWIFLLWTAFGTYVLVLWLVGAVLLGVARILPSRRQYAKSKATS